VDSLILLIGFLLALFLTGVAGFYSQKMAYPVGMILFASVVYGYMVYRLGFSHEHFNSPLLMGMCAGAAIIGAVAADRVVKKNARILAEARLEQEKLEQKELEQEELEQEELEQEELEQEELEQEELEQEEPGQGDEPASP